MTDDPRLDAVSSDGVLTLTLNDPGTLNALDEVLLTAVADAVEQAGARTDGEHRAIVIRGAGRGFCSGANIADSGDEETAEDATKDTEDPEDTEDTAAGRSAGTIDAANRLVAALVNCPLPTVAAVHGPCAGVGVSIALACDIVLAADNAFFQLVFSKVGLMPDGGSTALVAASAGRAVAMRMALLAERIGAAEAQSLNLVAAVVPADGFDARVAEVSRTLATGPAVASWYTTSAINSAALGALDTAFRLEREGQMTLLASPDYTEGVTAFAERRAPRFTDALATAEPLQSPRSAG